VGAGGTVIHSTNGGQKWDYAQPPAGKNLSWVGKSSGQFVASDEPDLRVQDGALHMADMVSRDRGESWTRETERYFPNLVDTHDGSGMQIANLVYRYGRDRLYVVTGEGEHDWVRIDSAYNEGGVIRCDSSSGCWMLASGVLYRPR
ncbi:MAG TPA: hypothetical protein VM869_24565, partial [Enhygromyxa sp.]|nr:hypothetical protein [Enhygromyxa sp.]